MKRLIIGVLIVFIILISAGMIFLYVSGEQVEPWIYDGEMKYKLIAHYEDGSTGEINLGNPIFGIFYEEKDIDQIQYVLEGKINGDNIKVNLTDYNMFFSVIDADGFIVNNFTLHSNSYIVDTVDGMFITLIDQYFDADQLFTDIDVDGDYGIRITPSGKITYESYDGWRESNLPSIMGFNVEYKTNGSGGPSIILDWRTSVDIE